MHPIGGKTRWYGYYSTEIDLSHAGEETEAGFVTYSIEIQARGCTYYKSQLHANEIYTCKVITATEDSIALQAVGQDAPNTDGKPLATLYQQNGKFYLSGPFIFDANGHTDVPIEVEKEDGTMKECKSMPQQQVHAAYKIISKESGAFYCLAINGKEYRLEDMLDYGEPDLKVYANDHSTIILTGLSDLYESIYFVYCFQDNTLRRLGQIDIA